MHLGELWQHRKTLEIVRIEMRLGPLLSFSILRGGRWVMCQHVWDVVEFRTRFRQIRMNS